MAQQWGYQGPLAQGQGYANYYPDPQFQQPPQLQHPQQQMHPHMYPQQQYAGPQHGPQYDTYQQQYPQQQVPQRQMPQQQIAQQQIPQQYGPYVSQQPVPQYNQQFGPQYNEQPGPQFAPQPGYQQNQQYGQFHGHNNPPAYPPPQQMYPQPPQQSFDRPAKPPMKLAKPSPASCFNCGSPEHWAMYCPEPRRAVPAGKLERSQSQGYGQQPSGFNPQAIPNQYSPQPSPSMGQSFNGYGYSNPQYSPPVNPQTAFHYSQGLQDSPQTPVFASSPGQFPVPYQQSQPLRHPRRSSFSAPSRSVPPSSITSVTNGNTFQKLPLPHEHTLQPTRSSPNAAVPPIEWRSTSNPKPSETRKVRAATVEPSEEGEVSRRASPEQSSRRTSIDQSVCMESEAEQEAASEPATPDYEPAEPEPHQAPVEPEELQEDDLEQLDVPDAPKYPGPFDAIGPQPVRFALPTKFEWNCGTLDVLPRPSPGSNGFVQSGYISKKSLVDMDCRYIDLPNYQHDPADPICLILHGDLKDALAVEEPQVKDEVVEDLGDDGTDRSMSCDEDEEKDEEKDGENIPQKASTSLINERYSIPQHFPSQHHPPQDENQVPASTNGIPFHAPMSLTDWETEQKLAALGVTGAPKPTRMPARPWQSAEPFRQPRHPPPPPEPLPIREENHQLSPVWHQGSSTRHESTPGFQETLEAPRQNGTGTPPYVPEVPEDLTEDNPWAPPGGYDSPFNSHSNGHTDNGPAQNGDGNQQKPQLPSDHRPSESNSISQDPTSPTSSRVPMQTGNTAGSPGEPNPVWKTNAPIRTSLKDRLAKINSRKREFEPEAPSDEDRGKERKRQEDDVTPRLKKRQPKVAEAYSRRW